MKVSRKFAAIEAAAKDVEQKRAGIFRKVGFETQRRRRRWEEKTNREYPVAWPKDVDKANWKQEYKDLWNAGIETGFFEAYHDWILLSTAEDYESLPDGLLAEAKQEITEFREAEGYKTI